jgi:hypothetical protein
LTSGSPKPSTEKIKFNLLILNQKISIFQNGGLPSLAGVGPSENLG